MNRKTLSQWFALMVMLVIGTTGLQAQSLTVADFEIRAGEAIDVAITLDRGANANIYGLQTDLTLPEGLTLSANPTVAEDAMTDATISYNATNGRIAVFSQAGSGFAAQAGAVVMLSVKAADTFEGGELKLSGSRLTISRQAGEITVADCTAQVTVPEGGELMGYTWDFNTQVNTSDHAFRVASNWKHIVGTYTDYWGEESYVSYTWSETAGVDATGALLCITNQQSNSVYDLIVTPVVKGTVTIQAKRSASYYEPQLTFYKIVEDANGKLTRGDQISVTLPELTTSAYATVTIPVAEEGERIGIRSSYVYLDNFAATSAFIVPEKSIAITTAEPTATTGTIYWDQQPNGKVLVKYTVTVTNNGEVALTQGTTGYSISIVNGDTEEVYATVSVPQDLAVGETSEPFDVTAEVEPTLWPSSYEYVKMYLVENLQGSVVQRAQSHYKAYEPVFVFRKAETTSTSSLTAAEAWGTVTEATTKGFEIYNDGVAPLVIKSITLPEGFTSDNAPEIPAEGLTIASKASQPLNITLPATEYGTFSGTLAIVYVDKTGSDATYTLAFSASYLNPNTWTADFNNTTSTVVYPEGVVVQAGINSDYQYISSGNYNNWITGRTTSSYASENNMFITPKLHATAGAQLAFDVKAGYGSAYYVKVYTSTDRKTWGEPVAYYTYAAADGAEAIGSDWVTKTVSFAAEGDYYVAFALYGSGSAIDNIVGLEKVAVAHDLYIKSVSWPDASIKSGTAQQKPSVDIIPLTNETADAYTVKYVCGETVLAEADAVALTASANSSKTISFAWTPEVEQTTTYPATKVVFEFTDGTTFETETFDLTVTNEAIFHFLNSKPSSKWYEPTDRTQPITFGKTNTADTQSFVIFNWGSAPLTVNSITLPDGFTTTTEFPLTVAAFNGENDGIDAASQTLDITFSATEAGNYSGDMVITYSGDKTFTLPVSGTKLDPAAFYANFDGAADAVWPAGSAYQDNISALNQGTYSAPNYCINSSSTTKNIFVTPKLTAEAGAKLLFDAKLYSSDWSEGKVVVYAAATRDELINFDPEADTRTPLLTVNGESEDEATKLTTDYQTFEVPAVAGDNYYAFEISNRAYVDEIYGLKVADVAHDLMIASSNIPAEAMQNVASTATVSVLNLGLADEAADAYTATLFIDGAEAATAETVALPMTPKLSAAGTQLSFTFRSPKAGTFPVYIEVKAGDYTVQTEPVDVNFAEEKAQSGVEMAAGTASNTNLLHMNWNNSESVSLYNAAVLAEMGLKVGDKISSITYKGYNTGAKNYTSTLNVWYEFTTDETQALPAAGKYDTSAMTNILSTERSWAAAEGSSSDYADLITINFETPIVYTGQSLRLVVCSEATQYQSGTYFVQSTKSGTGASCYNRNDTQSTFENTQSWSNNSYLPAIYLGIAAEPATIAGTVKDEAGAPIENATVTLVSNDGDNVQYTGTTDAEGAYSFNVIQTSRTYILTATADGYNDYVEENISFAEGSVEKLIVMTKAAVKGDANGDGIITTADATAIVAIAISGEEPTGEQLAVADLNEDGAITTADAVAVVELALEQDIPAGVRRVDMTAGNRLTVSDGTLTLTNSDEFVAFQMDVTVADDALLQGVKLADRVGAHQVAYRRIAGNTYRICVFSLSNDAIMHHSGELLQLQMSGSKQVTLGNVEFVSPQAQACQVALGEATAISGVAEAEAQADYFTVGGVRSSSMHKGLNIVTGKNGKTVKTMRK